MQGQHFSGFWRLSTPPLMWSRWKTKLTCRQAERWCWGLMWTNWSHSCFTWLVNSRGKATAFHSYMTLSCHEFRFDNKVVLNWYTWNENSGSLSRNLVFLTDHSVSSFLAKSKFLKDKLMEWLVLSAGQTSVRDMVDVPSGLLIFSLGSVSCGLHVSFFGWEFVFLLHVRVLSQNQRKPPTVCKRCT